MRVRAFVASVMVVPSLALQVERNPDSSYTALAPWLKEPITGRTWEEVYWKALTLRHGS